ncbi:hypothetical protein HID58_055782, partial [Brassica napus]
MGVIPKTRKKKNIPCLMSVEERVFQEEEMRLKSRLGKQHVEQSFSSRLAQNLMEAFYVKKQKNARTYYIVESKPAQHKK